MADQVNAAPGGGEVEAHGGHGDFIVGCPACDEAAPDVIALELGEDWLAQHDREVAAKAWRDYESDLPDVKAKLLRDIAEVLPSGVSHRGLCDWLRARADAIQEGRDHE